MALEKPISKRAESILKHLVHIYMRDGQPVGSKTLASQAMSNLSPATVRKVLCDLEEMGYLCSPHTSAGRIPTTQGIRFFVDSLLTVHPVQTTDIQRVSQRISPDEPNRDLIAKTSALLSEMTQMVGIVTLPQQEQLILRHLEFLPLSDKRVLVILVLNEREVQNRIIQTEDDYSASELNQAANFLNQHFSGKDLYATRRELLKSLKHDKDNMDSLMRSVLDVASKALEPPEQSADYVLAGQQNLFSDPSVTVPQLQQVFEAFTQKQQILNLLDHCLKTDGLQVYIGEESGYDPLRAFSLITTQYKLDGETIGALGIIGPTRMQYDKVISVVELTAKWLSALRLHSDK